MSSRDRRDIIDLFELTNKMHLKIKYMKEHSPEKFKKLGFIACGHCGGTGLHDLNPHEACSHCIGVGYVGCKEIDDENICPNCNGTGYSIKNYYGSVQDCSTCEGCGRLSWIDAVLKGIDLDLLWG